MASDKSLCQRFISQHTYVTSKGEACKLCLFHYNSSW